MALDKLYSRSYNYAGTAKTIQILGFIWILMILSLAAVTIVVALFGPANG